MQPHPALTPLLLLSPLTHLPLLLSAAPRAPASTRAAPAYTKYKMFRRLAFATLLYASLELTIHSIFNGRLDAMYWLFLALHQSMELLVAVMIGYTFRSQPFNILFAQVQQVAAELADQMLPTITTIEVKEDMLQVKARAKGSSRRHTLLLPRVAAPRPPSLTPLPPFSRNGGGNLIAWREDSSRTTPVAMAGRRRAAADADHVNPGDGAPSQTPLPRAERHVRGRRSPASAPCLSRAAAARRRHRDERECDREYSGGHDGESVVGGHLPGATERGDDGQPDAGTLHRGWW